eukprot:346608-Lingulodinium_polyedra.AAC.1
MALLTSGRRPWWPRMAGRPLDCMAILKIASSLSNGLVGLSLSGVQEPQSRPKDARARMLFE